MLCTVVALVAGASTSPPIQLCTLALAPVQLLLIIPFVRVGEGLLGHAPQPLSISAGLEIIAQGVAHAIVVLWDAILHATLGWIVIGTDRSSSCCIVRSVPVLERAARRFTREAVA